jgi:sRNA-binding carbon storage regulator CsrA
VRLGVQAPRNVSVFRGEVHARMLEEPVMQELELEIA